MYAIRSYYEAHRRARCSLPLTHDGKGNEQTQGHETHVGDRGIGDQLLHILLHERHEADVDDGDQRQADHQPVQVARGVGRDGQRESEETVGARITSYNVCYTKLLRVPGGFFIRNIHRAVVTGQILADRNNFV